MAQTTAEGIAQYLRDIGQVELIDQETEIQLGMLMDEGLAAEEELRQPGLSASKQRAARVKIARAERARSQFIQANLRLVVAEAARAHRQGRYRNLSLEDLIQEGNVGLIRAVEKYRWEAGTKFSTYAVRWIRQSMGRGVANSGRTIRFPVHATDNYNLVVRVKNQLESEFGFEPTATMIANGSGLSEEQVVALLALPQAPRSLNTPLSEDGDAELGDTIADKQLTDAVVVESMLSDEIRATLESVLSEREMHIIRMRYGMEDGELHTLEEVGQVYGCTRERIRQIECRTIRRLRDSTLKDMFFALNQ